MSGLEYWSLTMDEYYVYLLLDPSYFYIPFYVGKGKFKLVGNLERWMSHLYETEQNQTNPIKFNKIQKIRRLGFEPIHEIWDVFSDENKAYRVEKDLIEHFGREKYDPGGILTNICTDNKPPVYYGVNHWTYSIEVHPLSGIPRTDEIKKKVGKKNKISLKGNIPWNKGLRNVQTAWNKGTKGVMKPNSGSFQPGRTPWNAINQEWKFCSPDGII